MSIAIVGDIHGNVDRLRAALNELKRTMDELIFVGDYVDRGPDSKQVLEELVLLKLSWRDRVTFLRGNHDDALLSFLKTGNVASFISHGGLTTVKSYLPKVVGANPIDQFRMDFPPSHLQLLEGTQMCLEREGLLVSHCGYNPSKPASRSLESMVNGRFPAIFKLGVARPQDLVIFGHYVQRAMEPYIGDGIICLDTGCGTLPDGPLTVVILPSRKILQF